MRPVKRLLERDNPDDVEETLLILDIAKEDAQASHPQDKRRRLKLLPWAVQAALGRRHGGQRLSQSDIEEIKRITANPDEIRWPRGYAYLVKKSR